MAIEVYVYSNGWAEANRRFLSKTNHGDLNSFISDHFDTTLGSPLQPNTYKQLLTKIHHKPEDVLFLTKSPEEASAAQTVLIPSVLVMTHRRNIEKLNETQKQMIRVRSFNELELDVNAPSIDPKQNPSSVPVPEIESSRNPSPMGEAGSNE